MLEPGEKVNIYAISIDPPVKNRELVEKIARDGKGTIRFDLLSDPEHATIDAYGLRNTQHDGQRFEGIPHPAVYVLDTTGRVTWAVVEEDYKKRPTNAEIRTALGALKETRE